MNKKTKIRITIIMISLFILCVAATSSYILNSESVTAAVYDNQINYDSTGFLVGNFENYSPVVTYKEGDICLYNDGMYQCMVEESTSISPSDSSTWNRTSVLSTILNNSGGNSFHYTETKKPSVSKTNNITVYSKKDYLSDYKLKFTGLISTSSSGFNYDPVMERYYSDAYINLSDDDTSIDISLEYNGAIQNYTPLVYELELDTTVQEIDLDELIDQTQNFESILIAHSDLAKTLSTTSSYTNNKDYFELALKYMLKYEANYWGEALNSIKGISVSDDITTIGSFFANPAAVSSVIKSKYGKYFLELEQKFRLDDDSNKITVAQRIASDRAILKALKDIDGINNIICDSIPFIEALQNSELLETKTFPVSAGLELDNTVEKGFLLLGFINGYASGNVTTDTLLPETVYSGTNCYVNYSPKVSYYSDNVETVLCPEGASEEKLVYKYIDSHTNTRKTTSAILKSEPHMEASDLCYFVDKISVGKITLPRNYTVAPPSDNQFFATANLSINKEAKSCEIMYIDLYK